MTELHILNGDHALDYWQKCNFNAQALVWRETYLEGPLPETDDLQVFRKARAEYLSTFKELAGITQSAVYKNLQKMDDMILQLPETSTIMLWFDACIFDQTILMRILYLLSLRQTLPAKISLYCCTGHCLTHDDFQQGISHRTVLLPRDLATARQAWLFFQHRDAGSMRLLAEEENFDRMPQMPRALLRCADEIPDQNGLTLTRRRILQLVSNGCTSFAEIFNNLTAMEEYPFSGDTACQRNLDYLTGKKLLKYSGGKYSATTGDFA